jgi:hypothetical protein
MNAGNPAPVNDGSSMGVTTKVTPDQLAQLVAKLKPGATVNANVVAVLPSGATLLDILGARVEAQGAIPASPGQSVALQVQALEPALTLQFLAILGDAPAVAAQNAQLPAQSLSQVSTPPIETALQNLALRDTPQNRQIVNAMIKYEVPLTSANFATVSRFVRHTPQLAPEQVASAASLLLSRNLPAEPPLVGPFEQLLARPQGFASAIQDATTALESLASSRPELAQSLEPILQGLKSLAIDLSAPSLPQEIVRVLQQNPAEVLSSVANGLVPLAEAVLSGELG